MKNTDFNNNSEESRMVIHWAQIKQYVDKQRKNTQHNTRKLRR